MTAADRNRSGAVKTRLPLVILLCAVALGIVGMHGLGSGPASGGHAGHHTASRTLVTTDTTVGVVAPVGVATVDEAPPADDTGLLALCLMALSPGLALGSLLLARAARGGGWRLPRLLTRVRAELDVAVRPPPCGRQLNVLRI